MWEKEFNTEDTERRGHRVHRDERQAKRIKKGLAQKEIVLKPQGVMEMRL